jgi:hypothetical protein
LAVVEGKVALARASGGMIYMILGRCWSQALTVTILIEERTGPRIEATRPAQIEIARGK